VTRYIHFYIVHIRITYSNNFDAVYFLFVTFLRVETTNESTNCTHTHKFTRLCLCEDLFFFGTYIGGLYILTTEIFLLCVSEIFYLECKIYVSFVKSYEKKSICILYIQFNVSRTVVVKKLCVHMVKTKI